MSRSGFALALAATAIATTTLFAEDSATPSSPRLPAIARIHRSYPGNFAAYEPIYFIYGSGDNAAKFQFSFLYQLPLDDGWLVKTVPAMRGLTFGYTQRSVWDIRGDSSPFYDTSYMPEIGYLFTAAEPEQKRFITWLGVQASVQHESNGQGGEQSRSLNSFFIRPAIAFGDLDGWHVILVPRFYAYLSKSSGNANIDDYRSVCDLRLAIGRTDGPSLGLTGRAGNGFHHGSVQVDLTVPTKMFSGNLASYLMVQYWNGYGESLRDYDKSSHSIRAGLAFVR